MTMRNIRDTRWAIDEKEHKERANYPLSAGFTLTELLMVIATLVLLATIFLPLLQGVRLRGKEIECRNNLKQLGAAELLYLADNSRKMFPYQSSTWIRTLETEFPAMTNVLVCPLTTVLTPPPGANTAGDYKTAWAGYFNSPSGACSVNGSYILNGYLYGIVPPLSGIPSDAVSYVKDSNVLYPARTSAFGDGAWVDAWPSINDIEDDAGSSINLAQPLSNSIGGVGGGSEQGSVGMWRLLIARHGPNRVNPPPTDLQRTGRSPIFLPGGINMVFMDGHVDDVSLNSLWSLYWHPGWNITAPPN